MYVYYIIKFLTILTSLNNFYDMHIRAHVFNFLWRIVILLGIDWGL